MRKIVSQRHFSTVEKALHYIQQRQQQQPSLADIADHCAISEYHLQRIFSEWAGISPKQFLQHLTREQAKARLINGDNVLSVSAASGLSGSGRLHDLMVTLEAVSPGEIKSRGDGLQFYYGLQPSPFGDCFIVTSERGIHRIDFIDNADIDKALAALHALWPKATIQRDQHATAPLIQTIFSGKTPNRQLKLWVKGSQFQLKVWEALLRIPLGSLCNYGTVATSIGQPSASRAVGGAIGKNPVAMLIPCHRVIRSMGGWGNYRWGETRKQAMLGWEASRKHTTC